MKVVAIISHATNNDFTQWQFDKVMSAIAYDFEISLVFIASGIEQLHSNISWKSLAIYGVKDVYYFSLNRQPIKNLLIDAKQISESGLKSLVINAELII